MTKDITEATTLQELLALVSEHLTLNGISAILTGGSVVSVYTDNKYESKDLDFIPIDTRCISSPRVVDSRHAEIVHSVVIEPSPAPDIELCSRVRCPNADIATPGPGKK